MSTIPDWLPDPVKTCIVNGTHLVEFDEKTGDCTACGFKESAEWDYEIDQEGPIESSSLPDETNGWSREDVWVGDNGVGDNRIGYSYNAGYRNGARRLDLTYFVTGHHQNYDIELMAHSYTVGNDGEPMDEEYDYSHPFDFGFTEYEAALWAARNGAMRDERFKLG